MAAAPGIAVLLLLGSMTMLASATDYTVGDSSGWTTGVDYTTWASGKTFVAGDKLTFNYAAGVHTVDQVSATDYASCSAANALSNDASGQTSFTLSKAGTYNYICGVASHCSSGMKLSVTVSAATGGSTPTTPSTTTPSTTSTTNSGVAGISPTAASMGLLIGAAALKLVVF